MDDYMPKSHKFKEEQKATSIEKKKVEKVVTGVAKVKKKSEVSKLKDIFISEDASNVKSYIIMDVLVPAIKKAIADIVTNGIDMILYGETGHSKRSSSSSKISYRSYYDRRDDDRRYDRDRSLVKQGYDYDDVIIETRGEADAVISRMEEIIDMYGRVSVADLYDLVGITGNYTDNNYGWTNLASAEPIRVRDGYVIKLPKAMPIK